jgi:hypothetical protein
MGAALLVLLPPWVAGYLAARWAWPGSPPPWSVLFRASLATGLAVGASSVTFFLWAVWAGPRRPGLFVAEVIGYSGLAVLLWRGGDGRPRTAALAPGRVPALLRLAFWFVVLCAVVAAGFSLWQAPHGDWDAWAIWNLRARFLYRGGEHWTAAFSPLLPWTHPDYPLLVPAAVARGWTAAGQETTRVPCLLACLFAAATVGFLVSGLALFRGPAQGYLGGVVLLATPYFVELATAQYADVPLGFFVLACAGLFEMHDRCEPGNLRLPLLAGLLAGMAAWTKNEGQLFLVATVLARLLTAVRRRHVPGAWGAVLRELAAFALGLLPLLAVLVYFKLRLAPVNDLVAGQGWAATGARLASPQRYGLVAAYFLWALWCLGPGAVVVLAGYFWLLGPAPHQPGRCRTGHTAVLLALMLAGYALVYLATPNDLAWHLASSVHRLFMQLWPAALLAFFLAAAAPGEGRG